MIDLHAHVLPGIDDGAPDIDAALTMCELAERDGTERLVAAFHLLYGGGVNDAEMVGETLSRLQGEAARRGIRVQLSAASEVPVIEDLVARLNAGQITCLDPVGRYMLLESPHLGELGDALCSTVAELRGCGVTPVITHPELSACFRADASLSDRVIAEGALMQVTARSLTHALAGECGETLARLMERGHIHAIASDGHDVIHRPPVLSVAYHACASAFGSSCADLLFDENPRLILSSQPVRSPGPLAVKGGGVFGRWTGSSLREWVRAVMRSHHTHPTHTKGVSRSAAKR